MNRVTFAYLCGIFVRKRRNKWGTTSVVVVDKCSGRFKELATIGVASFPEEIAEQERKACRWMERYGGQQSLDFEETAKALEEVHRTLSMVERTMQNAPQVILERVYERIEFNAVEDDILRHLVIARVCQPMSKAATVEYLKSYFDEDIKLHNIYR